MEPISIEAVYARAGRRMRVRSTPERAGSIMGEREVVRWRDFEARRVEREWLREHELSEDVADRYRALSRPLRSAVHRCVREVEEALGDHVGQFAPDKVVRVRYWQKVLPPERWHELFHKLVLAEGEHFDQRIVHGALRGEERMFRIRLLRVQDAWGEALNLNRTSKVSVHELHAVLTVASLALLDIVERAVKAPKPRHLEALLP